MTGIPPKLAVVLVETRNPLNIGAAARAMSNFGFPDLRLVNPYDLAFREAVSAVNAEAVVQSARVFQDISEAVADCHLVVAATGLGHRKPSHPLLPLEQAGVLLRQALAGGHQVALLFGSEKHGISNEHAAYCHWLLRIPTRPQHESMNLAQAVAVCLYELVRAAGPLPAVLPKEEPATAADVERLAGLLLDALKRSGYRDFTTQPSAIQQMRRLVRRLQLVRSDAPVWTGMVRQILWRLENPGTGSP
jgi:tRNA/rRNA methyltransferase